MGPKSTRSRIIGAGVLVLVLAFVALTLRLFVYPDVNAPERSNAIVVLGADGAGPFDEAVALAKEGYAPTVAFSVPAYPCADSVLLLPTQRALFPPSKRVLCFRADPATTQGEARSIAQLAAANHWRRIIVVMPTTQATRARLRIGRCYSGQVLEVGVPPAGLWAWTHGIMYEWGALLKALVLQPSC